jgi:hypothetical protein
MNAFRGANIGRLNMNKKLVRAGLYSRRAVLSWPSTSLRLREGNKIELKVCDAMYVHCYFSYTKCFEGSDTQETYKEAYLEGHEYEN